MAGEHREGLRPAGVAESDLAALAPNLYRGELVVTVDNSTDRNPQRLLVAKAGAAGASDFIPAGVFVSAPASSSDAGFVGQMAYDGTYLYVCVATDTWERVAWDATAW